MLFLIQKLRKGEYEEMPEIIASAITGGLALVGVIVTNVMSNRKIENKLQTSQAVTDCKITELTREVREHNNFARRVPAMEEKIEGIVHRVEVLERKG